MGAKGWIFCVYGLYSNPPSTYRGVVGHDSSRHGFEIRSLNIQLIVCMCRGSFLSLLIPVRCRPQPEKYPEHVFQRVLRSFAFARSVRPARLLNVSELDVGLGGLVQPVPYQRTKHFA